MKRLAAISILLLAFCGLADAAYLTQHVINGTPVLCNVHGLSDCNAVIGSPYSDILGIPIAVIGVFFYGVLFILAALELLLVDRFLRRVLQAAAVIGVLGSLYFIFLQVFVLHAFCAYCLVSAVITFLVLVAAFLIEPIKFATGVSEAKLLTMPPRL